MASREEEKRQRREARMAAEAQAAAAAKRQKRVQFALGALLVVAAIAGVVLAISSGGGGGGGGGAKTPTTSGKDKLPALQQADLAKAAKAAGCVLLNPAAAPANHVNGKVKYATNPPSSGNHSSNPAPDGIYDPANAPSPEDAVHSMEHGRVEIQYRPGTDKATIADLETLVSEPIQGKAGYKTLLFQNSTNMPYAVAATAWGHILGCKSVQAPQIWDALRDFRTKYVDQGPEKGIPPTN